jgi:hypothetical protein
MIEALQKLKLISEGYEPKMDEFATMKING